jgi:hypothetical protein
LACDAVGMQRALDSAIGLAQKVDQHVVDARVLDAGGGEKQFHAAVSPLVASGAPDRHDLGSPCAAWCIDFDGLAHGSADQRAAERRVGRNTPRSHDTRNFDLHARAVLVVDLDDRPDPDLAGIELRRVDEHSVVEARAQLPNARLEQTLLVLRGVVFEVLGQIAVLTRRLDRLNDCRSRGALELRKFVGERLPLRRCQLIDSRFAQD